MIRYKIHQCVTDSPVIYELLPQDAAVEYALNEGKPLGFKAADKFKQAGELLGEFNKEGE